MFHPFSKLIDIPDAGKVSALEMVDTTENTKGKAAFDKMKAESNAGDVAGRVLEQIERKEINGRAISIPAIAEPNDRCGTRTIA